MVLLKKCASNFLQWYCDPDCLEDIQGDLEEIYVLHLREGRQQFANINYALQVLLLFRPSVVRKPEHHHQIIIEMFRNYFKIGIRNLLKYRSSTIIHVFGLALGLAAFLLINQYTTFEKSYDKFHPDHNQLVRLTTDNIVNGEIQARDAMSFAPSASVLKEELPEVIDYTTSFKFAPLVFKKGDQVIEEEKVIAVDSNFLNLFGYEIISAQSQDLLAEPNTLVFTQSQARKYFGHTDILGQSIEILGRFRRSFVVAGILKDTPENTHYKFDVLISLASIKDQIEGDDWNGYNYYTYLKLAPRTDLVQLQNKLGSLSEKYLSPESQLFFHAQPVEDIHLHSDFTFEPEINGSAKAVRFLGLISLFILVIAWVNYINLSTARAIDRAKEVGLRKVIGARKKQLIGQFLTEALLINLMGALAALALVQLATPYFNNLVGREVLGHVWTNPDLLLKLSFFFLIGVLAAGLYPALVLSSFKPIQVIQGKFKNSKTGHLLRKGLVIIQFAASLILIANTIIVFKQVEYLINKDKGIDINRVIGFNNPRVTSDQREQYRTTYQTFLQEIQQLSGVEKVASMGSLPGGGSSDIGSQSGGIQIVGKTETIKTTIYVTSINDQVQSTLNIDMIAGRNFHRAMGTDTSAVIVNTSLLKKLNIADPSSILNEKLMFGSDPDNEKYSIVGVFGDYNRSTLKNQVEPTVFFYRDAARSTVIKLNNEGSNTTFTALSNIWARFFPEAPFYYIFLDQRFEKLYQEDQRFGQLFANFSILAIIVASLGLFGLSSFLASKRKKEIGIRKVLGASIFQIVVSFFREYIWLILLASLVGIPLIYIAMNQWLHGYANHILFPWWVILVAMGTIFVFAFLTVGYQNYKVAQLNPSEAIRYE